MDNARLTRRRRGIRWCAWALLAAGLLVVVAAFKVSYGDMGDFIGEDLFTKVIGARTMLAGFDPYEFDLETDAAGQPSNPPKAERAFVQHSYPPTLICLYATVANLPYHTQRRIWFFVDWAAMVGTVALLAWLIRGRRERYWFVCLACFWFLGGYFWRVHVERGQYYAYVLLLMSLGCAMCIRGPSRHRRGSWLASLFAAIPFGLAAALRPSLVLAAPVLWILGYRRVAISTSLTALLAVGLTLPLVGMPGWKGYFRNVSLLEQDVVFPGSLDQALDRPVSTQPVELDAPTDSLASMSVNTTMLGDILPFLDNLFHPPRRSHWMRHGEIIRGRGPGDLSQEQLDRRKNWVSWSHYAAIGSILIFMGLIALGGLRHYPRRVGLGVMAVFLIALDFYVPVRYAYADVLFLLPIALLLRLGFSGPLPWWMVLSPLLILGGLVFGHAFVVDLPEKLGPRCRAYGVGGGLCLGLIWICLTRARVWFAGRGQSK